MNKIVTTLTLLILTMSTISTGHECYEFSLEVRGAALLPTSHRFRHIYGHAVGDLQLEAGVKLRDCLKLWAQFDWFEKHGRSIGFCDPTKIDVMNGALGIKFMKEWCDCLYPYLNGGFVIGGVKVKNRSICCLNERCAKAAAGFVVGAGFYWFTDHHLFFDAFVDYLYQPVKFQERVNVGGFKIGAGIGVTF